MLAYGQVSLQVNWTDLQFGGGPPNEAQSVAFNRNRVIAGEVLGNASGGVDVHVRGYNANTGNLVWEDIINGGAVRVDAVGNDAFAAVNLSVSFPNPNILIRSYNQRTGDIQWSTTLPRYVTATAFAVRGNRVLLTAYSSTPFWNKRFFTCFRSGHRQSVTDNDIGGTAHVSHHRFHFLGL